MNTKADIDREGRGGGGLGADEVARLQAEIWADQAAASAVPGRLEEWARAGLRAQGLEAFAQEPVQLRRPSLGGRRLA